MSTDEVVVHHTVVTFRDDDHQVADLSCYAYDLDEDEEWAIDAYRAAGGAGARGEIIAVLGSLPGRWIVGPVGAAPELEDEDEDEDEEFPSQVTCGRCARFVDGINELTYVDVGRLAGHYVCATCTELSRSH